MKKITLALLSLIPLASLTACAVETDVKTQTANHIARPAFMVERTINAGAFGLGAWERMHTRNAPATIYIEGDGIAPITLDGKVESTLSPSPTPANPTALTLASRDLAENVGYLSRPCQYVKDPESKGCSAKYWTSRKYSPEVLMAYDSALNDIAARYDITEFNLVGHGGGANIAAILSVKRGDVVNLRTVAGNLSPTYVTQYHNAPALDSDSLLATNFGPELANVPQHHFIGAADKHVPPGTYHSYRQAVGLSDCINYSVIQDADHSLGWAQIWPQLLALNPQCAKIQGDLPPLPPASEFPGNYYKGLRK